MYLKKTKKPNGRVYLSIVESRRDGKSKHAKTITIQKLGYLDELGTEYPDPIAHYATLAAQMTAAKNESQIEMTLTINGNQRVEGSERKNFGYVVLSAVYHELEIHKFLEARQKSLDVAYNLNSIMRMLVFSRLLYPGSKKKAYDERDRFFERCDFGISDMYRALSRFGTYRDAMQLWMHSYWITTDKAPRAGGLYRLCAGMVYGLWVRQG